MNAIGQTIPRKEAVDKVTGAAKYNDDIREPGLLFAKLTTSTCSHGLIKSIDTTKAWEIEGIRAVITGEYLPALCGSVISDHPPIAIKKVRYYGEPVAVVVADTEHMAQRAAYLINVEYEPLPIVKSPSAAMEKDASLIHENLGDYKKQIDDVYPVPNTNIIDYTKIRKGDMARGWAESEVVVEGQYFMPKSDHVAMETRNVRVKIDPSGKVFVSSSTQSPFAIKKQLSKYYGIEESDVLVTAPLVGGAFGGKAPVQLEYIAYLASKSVGGRPVKMANTRSEDIATSPSKIGVEAKVKLGATRDGMLKAVELTYMVDAGAYADTSPRMAKTMASNCTGPYNIENVWCDSYTLYTNNNYSTSFRGFGNTACAFCIERTLDKLANALGVDPFELRLKNAIGPGHTSPTQVRITHSNTGDLTKCIYKLKDLMDVAKDTRVKIGENKIRSKGISCFWKTSASSTDVSSGVILIMNKNGSINLVCGAVEIGSGVKTGLAQILAERMKMDVDKIHVQMEIDTESSPNHWKTVASMTTFMAGRATLSAAEDLIDQLLSIGAMVMKCHPSQLDIGGQKVYMKADPDSFIEFKEIAQGYKFEGGNAVGGQIIGKGTYIMENLTVLDPKTGKGKMGPAWSLGAQAVEVEYSPREHTYKILKAATVLDGGKIINPKTAKGVVMGGMSMGIGLGSREYFQYGTHGGILNSSFRTYKVIRFGEQPDYLVEFVETPAINGPYGARGFGEHGILGIPAALANALSRAVGIDIDEVPINTELIWRLKGGE